MSIYYNLEVWKVAHALVLNVHSHVKRIRGSEYVSLKSQMLRAAMSVPTNLVEGSGQESPREFCRFIKIALNSSSELEYHLLLARDFGVMRPEIFNSLRDQTVRVRKMLWGLQRGVSRRVTAKRGGSVASEQSS